jgi:DNA-binding CsgD family transcriptional regulator
MPAGTKRTAPACAAAAQQPSLAAPAGLQALGFELGGEEFLVLAWPSAPLELPALLTSAEREVVALVRGGLSNGEIARRRGRSVRTVANQVASIFGKLGVGSRAQLVARLSLAA